MTDTQPALDPVTIVDDGATADPAAPYGRFANGKPRKAPAKSRAAQSNSGPKAPKAAAATPRRKGPGSKVPNFTKMLTAGFQVIGTTVLSVGARTRNRSLLADGMAVRLAAPELAKGANEVVAVSPALQAALTKAGPVMPYAALGMALLGLGAQIAANHGIGVPGVEVHDPGQLAEYAEAEMHRGQEQGQERQEQGQEQQQRAQHDYAVA